MQFIGPTKRLAIARLANVAASSAPPALTSAAAKLHRILLHSAPVQEHEFLEADDELAEAIAALPGLFATQLDLLGILHGKDAQLSRHRIHNVGAALRDKAAKLGRMPADADFSSDHPVVQFAWAYWGGVAAWAAGSPARVQRPKGFWTAPKNQIAALRTLAKEHPGVPITHALLHTAGLHRLGAILDAATLEQLADQAGVDRDLCYRPRGWWTQERTIDAYAETCRRAGVTLSTTALTALGGEACSLKSYAAAHFGTFAAFQRAVVARHPDIRLPSRPIAADGTEMDSWSEVPVYDSLCVALPDARIAVHVILPGQKKRSCDIVINDCVYVEILGIARSAMSAPASSHKAKYAAQWVAKAAIYASLGIKPVVIEPNDIHDPERLAACIASIAALLQCDPAPLPPSSGRSTRAKGSWDFDKLRSAIEEVADGTAMMPTYEALRNAGFGHAACLLRQPGMRARVVSALTLADPHARGQWTRDRVVVELAGWLSEYGYYPTKTDLQQAGQGALESARSRLWKGAGDILREAVGAACGAAVRRRRAPDRSIGTVQQAAAALAPLAKRLGRMPSGREAAAAKLGTAWAHASRGGGVAQMAARIGVPCLTRHKRSRAEMLKALSGVTIASGSCLTTTLVRAQLGSGGVAWVRRLGGIAAVRAALASTTSSESPTA